MVWLVKQHEEASQRATTPKVAEISIPVCDKGKRKIGDHMEEEKSCKFLGDRLVVKEAMAVEAKRKQRDR